jgi:hypothetical protein
MLKSVGSKIVGPRLRSNRVRAWIEPHGLVALLVMLFEITLT